jgi:hypothetical protein
MLEKEFYAKLVKPYLEIFGCCERMENAAGSGTPDINYSGGLPDKMKRTGFIETKIVYSGKLHFELYQLPWLARRGKHAPVGTLWVMTYEPKYDMIGLVNALVAVKAPRKRHAGFVEVEAHPDLFAVRMAANPRKDWHLAFAEHMFM